MSLLSDVKNAARRCLDAAEHTAETAAGAVADAAKTAASSARSALSEAPSPSPASLRHASKAAADAARNANTANVAGAKKSEAKSPNLAVYAGFGVGAAAGADSALGGEISAGGLVRLADGEAKSFGSVGSAAGAAGASVGAGFEAGVILDSKAFYGEGHHYVATASIWSANVQTTPEGKINAVSIGVAKSSGMGIFHFETNTEDTTGR